MTTPLPPAEALRLGPVAAAIRERRLVVVLRRIEPQARLLALVDELAEAGARIFEITFDAPAAANDVAALRDHLASRDGGAFLVGAGTITRTDQLVAALRAGAAFGVAPFLDPEIVRDAVSSGLPFIPGALTPSEAVAGWAAGATFVKVFPASAVGPAFIREMRGPLPHVGLIPTGGVDASNIGAYLEAGAVAVGVGSALSSGDPAKRRAILDTVARAGR